MYQKSFLIVKNVCMYMFYPWEQGDNPKTKYTVYRYYIYQIGIDVCMHTCLWSI